MAEDNATKVCRKCQATKPLTEFYQDKQFPDGRRNSCRACDAAAAKERWRRNLAVNRAKGRECYARRRRNNLADCQAKARAYAAANPERLAYLAWESQLRRAYGLSVADYDAMVAQQGGLCAICNRPERVTRSGKQIRLAVDHDHETGKVRGLLCMHCNQAIGKMEHRVDLLQQAVAYLTKVSQ